MTKTPHFRRPDLPKRFYKDVAIVPGDDGRAFSIVLDGRVIKTPLRRPLIAPALAIAETMAVEWRDQGDRIDPATMPVTRLANTAIDGTSGALAETLDDLARYAETDMLFYRAGEPERLAARQRGTWDPIVRATETALDVRFSLAEGVVHVAQSEASLAAVRRSVSRFEDPFAVAALHQMTTLTGSALIALSAAEGRLGLEDAWAAAHLDEDWNIELWGVDDEAQSRRTSRFVDMKAAVSVIDALRPA